MSVQVEKHWVSGEGDGEISALTPSPPSLLSLIVSHWLDSPKARGQGPRCNSHRAPPRTHSMAKKDREGHRIQPAQYFGGMQGRRLWERGCTKIPATL